MSVPNSFGTATGTVPLSNLDLNFAYYDAAYQIAASKMTINYDVAITGLTASQAIFTDANDNLVSNAITGTGNVVMSASPTFTGTIVADAYTGSGLFTLANTTTNIALGTSQTTGTLIAGGLAQTGAITLGQSTDAQTLNLATGATLNAITKTINLGTAGVSGSITEINIGSAVAGATGTTTLNNTINTPALTASQAIFTNASKNLVSNAITGTGSVVMSASPTLTGTITAAAITASDAVTMSATTQAINLGTSQTTGTFVVGGAAQTGAITVGQSTGAQTLNLASGATLNATTKTINIGASGVSGSTVNLNFGSAVAGSVSSHNFYGNLFLRSGACVVNAPAPTAIAAAATLTNANIQTQIINTTGTTYTVTMPLGTTLETLAPWPAVNLGYDFAVVNTASGIITMAANTGVTTLGALTIPGSSSAQFRIRRTAANTFIMYRLT